MARPPASLLRWREWGGAAEEARHEGSRDRVDVEGLWFIGAQSESGDGVPAVMKGARNVARRILSEA
jgi:hypothetical protein